MASLTAEQGLQLLEDLTYADMTIICGGQSLKVHRLIVCAASPFFAACMKEGFSEGQTSTVTLQKTSPLAVASATLFIYTNDFSIDQVQRVGKHIIINAEELEKREGRSLAFADAYILGDRLLDPGLQARSSEKFMDSLGWNGGVKSVPVLVNLVKHVFSNISLSDKDLRPRLLYYTAGLWCGNKVAHANIAKVLNEYEPFGFNVFKLRRGLSI